MKDYKKILVVLLTLCTIVTLFTASVCAEEQYTVKGKWEMVEWNRTYVLQNIEFTYSLYPDVTFTQILSYPGGNYCRISNGSQGISYMIYESGEANYGIFDFGSTPQQVSKEFSAWLENSAQYMTCDGSTCPATDMNYDNICDDCGMAFTFNLRNDTYSYNGYYLPSAIEDESGTIVNLNNYWNETLSKNDGNLVILNGESTDNALLYHFFPDVVFRDGQVVTTGKTQVTLYKPSTNENGYLYWKKSATDTWNTSGALVASVEHVDWVANAVTDENGYTAINGDVNFQTPLWVEIQGVTEGEMTVQLPKMGGTMKILVACGVGLMACLVVLSLFGKRSLIFRN